MPLPLALIAGALSAGSGVTSALLSNRQAKKNRQFQAQQNLENIYEERRRYNIQRADALADWNAQNQYNAPIEQMNRLRQAGLNPHLVYGKGAEATADAIRSSQFGTSNRPAPTLNADFSGITQAGGALSQGIMQGLDLKAKQAQIDNMNQSNALMQQEALFKQANTAKTIQDTASGKFELGKAQELKDSVIENQKLQNEKLKADTTYTVDQNRRTELQNTQNMQLTLEKIITEKIAHAKDDATIDLLKEQLKSVQQTQDINRYEQELTNMGIYKSDPWYFRAMMNLIHGNLSDPSQNWDWRNLLPNKGTPTPEYNRSAENQFNQRK